MILGLVGVQLARPAAATALAANPNARHGAQGGHEHSAITAVGTAQRQAQRRAVGVCDEVALGARPAAIRRVRPDLRVPLLAATLVLRVQLATSRWLPPLEGAPAAPRAGGSTHRPSASPVAGASRSFPTSSPSPRAAAPTACRWSARRQCRSGLRGPATGGDRLSLRPLGQQQRLDRHPEVIGTRGFAMPDQRHSAGSVRCFKSQRYSAGEMTAAPLPPLCSTSCSSPPRRV